MRRHYGRATPEANPCRDPHLGPHSGFALGRVAAIDLSWVAYQAARSRNPFARRGRSESALSSQTLPEAFRLRAGNFNLLVLRLLDPRPDAVLPALGDQFRRAPGFLRFAPIVIGLADLEAAPEEVDFRGLIAGLHALEIVPIGTSGGSQAMRQAAQHAGLPPLRPVGGKDAEIDLLRRGLEIGEADDDGGEAQEAGRAAELVAQRRQ
ncbi:MAG: hypothetical protein EON47_11525, partial [Acetobacteraceae bacterium]